MLSFQVASLRAQLDVTVARERALSSQLSTVEALTAEVTRLRANGVEMEEEMASVEEMHAVQLAQVQHAQSLTGARMQRLCVTQHQISVIQPKSRLSSIFTNVSWTRGLIVDTSRE